MLDVVPFYRTAAHRKLVFGHLKMGFKNQLNYSAVKLYSISVQNYVDPRCVPEAPPCLRDRLNIAIYNQFFTGVVAAGLIGESIRVSNAPFFIKLEIIFKY